MTASGQWLIIPPGTTLASLQVADGPPRRASERRARGKRLGVWVTLDTTWAATRNSPGVKRRLGHPAVQRWI